MATRGHGAGARLALAWLRRAPVVPLGPLAVVLETTVRCNLHCPSCLRTLARLPPEDMPLDIRAAALAGAGPAARLALLFGMGEPLLDPHLSETIAECRRRGLSSSVSTNGTLLAGSLADRLLARPPDTLIVAVDGASPETYARHRPGASYPQVVANLEAFAGRKPPRGPPFLVAQMVRYADNRHEVAAFVRHWRGVRGVDAVRVKEEELGLPAHRSLAAPEADRRRNPCHFLWQGPVLVRWDGRVWPCCFTAPHDPPIGRIGEHSLSELWNSERVQAMRRLHAAGRAAEIPACAACPAPRPRAPAIAASFLLHPARLRRLVPLAERLALAWHVPIFEPRQRQF